MMSSGQWILTFAVAAASVASQAKDWYVDGANGDNGRAGTSWSLAKKTIAAAYNSASSGDIVHVADGVYPRVSLSGNRSVTIRSEGGWTRATIDANREDRCAYLGSEGETNIVLQGFTLTNGYRDGSGAGAYNGTLKDCRILGNEAAKSGGAAYGSYLCGCLVVSNVAGNCAGAVYNGRMVACKAFSNVATNWGGAFYGGVAENCVIAGNSCGRYGGGAYETTLFGCTVFGNTAGLGAGGIYGSSATNSIIWANTVGKQIKNYYGGSFGNCVLYPLAGGAGNSSENPRLFSVEGLDGRICTGSPCFNTGDNDAVHEPVDVDGNARIQKGTVDIGAYEGVVDGSGDFVEDAEKTLTVRPGITSSFSLGDGSRAFIFGIGPLSANDFEEISEDGILEYVNSGIIDAEKTPSTSIDDYWCQQLTEVNLCVWSGWSQYVGFLNEDDFADFIRSKGDFANRQNILEWVMGKSGYKYNEYVSWSQASHPNAFVKELVDRTKDGDRWIYLQLDWVTPGTTNIIGSHAITCCGYQLASEREEVSPEDLIGLYIIDSDNDKRTGLAGRYAPNSVTRIPVTWDAAKQKFFLKFSNSTGMARFLCYLKARPYRYAEAAVPIEKGAVPYSWLVSHGVYDPTTDESPESVLARPTGKRDGLGRELTVWHDYLAGTDPLNANDVLRCHSVSSNGHFEVAWSPNLGDARIYAVYGKTNLSDAAWHFPTNEGSRFLTVGMEMCETVKANGFGFIDGSELVATNRFAMSKGALSLYSDAIVDAEKIDGTDLDDRGCGEATGANMVVMTGWAQLAGFADEDEVFRSFYQVDGTADYGTYSVVKHVFDRLPGHSFSDYYESEDSFDATTFQKIEAWLDRGCAIGVMYLHGTPASNEGNHVVTVWGVCKDLRYLPADPRHYSAVIISDSDDDKHGHATAGEAPNRVKIWPVSWNETEKVYYIDDGFLVDVRSLAPAPGRATRCASNAFGMNGECPQVVAEEPVSVPVPAIVKCKVTFGKNGGTGGDNYVTATYGSAMPTPRTAPKKMGYTFEGYWDTTKEGGKQYYDGSMKSVRSWDKKAATTLWAKWVPARYKVTFGKNGGTGGDDYVTVTYTAAMPTPRTAPKKSGYIFEGYWNTTGENGICYYDANMKSAHVWDKTSAVTLWAKWRKAAVVKVTLGKNGGSGGDNYVTCTEGQPMPTPRTVPTRTGWTFAGYWDTLAQDANGNPKGKQYYDASMKSVRNFDKSAEVTLWAKWTVRVTLGKNGGTGGDDYVTVIFNQPFPKRAMPKKSGYAFGGYFVSASSRTGQCYNPDGTGTASMKWSTGGTPTIWALWTKTSSCVELPPAVARRAAAVAVSAPSASAAPAPEVPAIPAGIYSGVLADGTGAFWLVLDEPEKDAPRTAFLYVASEDGSLTAECTAEEVDGVLLLTTEDGAVYAFDPKAGMHMACCNCN